MKLRIRIKFIGILVIAAVLPLGIALISAQWLGYRYYRKAQGTLLETRARELARSLGLAVNGQVGRLHDWIALSDLRALAVAEDATQVTLSDDEFKASVDRVEARWTVLKPTEEPLRAILQNEMAGKLRAFQMMNPLFVEVFATNARGGLIAATEKTSDFWQADEVWWQRAMRQKFHRAFVEGINYDASAGVYSVDVAVPIRQWQRPDDPPVGVVKGVLNASPLLTSFAPTLAGDSATYQVVLADGRILAQLSGQAIEPLAQRVSPEVVARFQRMRPGSMLVAVRGGALDLAGFAPLNFADNPADSLGVTGLTPMYVLVYRSADEALAPVRKQILMISGAGALLILGCVLAGYWVAGKKIIAPVEALRSAAQAIGATAKISDQAPMSRSLPALAPIQRIKTGDELQDLAQEFEYMAERVLTYHERLEGDLALKTAEIDRDLQMAREFQEALMPREYPRVPSSAHPAEVALEFHHVYRPANSVGGDFFDVLKLSDHRAGVFIADVMGHGARSALVTAILRTLLHNLAFGTDDPAKFLTRLNHHFHEIVCESEDTIFVSAFYLIIDTETATATYASAGHPSPFVANRTTREARPLIDKLKGNPALGLLPAATYCRWTQVVKPGDIFLLFTDGVHEAYNMAGEEFGLERVQQVITTHLPSNGHELSTAVVEAVNAFIAPAAAADDICLVTVEVTTASAAGRVPAPRLLTNS